MRLRAFCPTVVSPFSPVHVNATGLRELEVPSTAKDHHPYPCGRVCGALPLLAGSCNHRTCSSLFRKTSTRPLVARYSRSPSRPRALPRLLQMNVSASTTMDHSNIPDHRRVIGTTPVIEGCPSMQANRRRYAGSGVEKPNLDAPHRDCSRWRLCPNPDRFRHLLSRACL